MEQRGFIVIADITGYTTYLNESELEHAQGTLTELLRLLIDHTKSPLIISRLEGDAVISYGFEAGFVSGQTLLEILESTYVDFRKAIECITRYLELVPEEDCVGRHVVFLPKNRP